MPLSTDTLLDRLHLKAQITRWRLIAIGTAVLAALVVFERNSTHSPMERPFVARVTIEGIVMDDPKRDEMLDEIRDNPRIKAVVLRLDTPGGSAVAGMSTFRQLRKIAETKPVVAVMRDLSASAGYLIALGADRVFANEGTLTGSIGVIVQSVEFSELAQKIGIAPVTVKTGAHKDMLSPYHKAQPEDLAIVQSVIDDFYAVFVDTVAERRALPRDEVLKLADGRIFSGRQAIKAKLVDAIGGERTAVAWLEKEKNLPTGLEIRDMKEKNEPLPFLQHLADSAMQKIIPGASGTLDGLVAIWHPNLQIQ